MSTIAEIIETVRSYAPDADVEVLMSAYLLAARAHTGQMRKSGEAYLTHPIAVAQILADLQMDVDTIATALLHDALEDNPMSKREMTDVVGPVITELVDGVTKIGKLKYKSKVELQAENFRKMMLAMSRDLRVILVKLADRLHNMRTLEGHREEKRRLISRETLAVYAPIANRLGLSAFKNELEDICFRHLHPEAYAKVDGYLMATQQDRDAYTARVVKALEGSMAEQGVTTSVSGRAKARFSIFKKMQSTGSEIGDLHDLLAFRLIMGSVADCYMALGNLHASYELVPDRIKDYIARPKPNGYQSLHTTVIGPEGKRIEVQIRTEEMHRVAEQGIAAHWRYKEGHLALSPEDVLNIGRIREVFEEARDVEDATEFMATLKRSFYADEVFVVTPRGDVMALPMGATPIDFAYSIHTGVGEKCAGAKVNGRIVPLAYELQSGDVVEVITHAQQRPNRDWLELAKTGRAQSKIRRFLRKQEEDRAIGMGADILKRELERVGFDLAKARNSGALDAFLKLRERTLDQAYVELARGTLTAGEVARALVPEGTWFSSQEAAKRDRLASLFSRPARSRSVSPVLISGEDGVLVHYAQCCAPLPGEDVVGFITRGRGISVHRRGCVDFEALEASRKVPVEWDLEASSRHSNNLTIDCEDRPGILAAITSACDRENVNIEQANATRRSDGGGRVMLRLAVDDLAQLTRVIRQLEQIAGVTDVKRRAG